jgi:hypothetical protein
MTTTTQESALHESLGKLESALLSPVIAGELLDWVEAASLSCAEVGTAFAAYARDVLQAQYKEIARSDTELLYRIQQSTAEDQRLEEELQAFCREFQELAQRAPDAQKDELRVEDRRRHLEERGTKLVLAIRKHQLAVNSWLNEAVNRDRGPGD